MTTRPAVDKKIGLTQSTTNFRKVQPSLAESKTYHAHEWNPPRPEVVSSSYGSESPRLPNPTPGQFFSSYLPQAHTNHPRDSYTPSQGIKKAKFSVSPSPHTKSTVNFRKIEPSLTESTTFAGKDWAVMEPEPVTSEYLSESQVVSSNASTRYTPRQMTVGKIWGTRLPHPTGTDL